ncbi:MAG: NAD-dependent epimerase/dehydratase family protein [Xanthomonadales bacterium]|nr:NAD-dependent epimerase/dehydratase family protein [Xanthomonadales bacterium]
MKKVAVTGASGHIGANLVRELIGRGYEVVTLIRQTSLALEGLDVVRVDGNVLDQQSLCKAFRGVEQVYHLAAYISIQSGDNEKLEQVNIEGTRNVLEACRSEGVSTLVYFSSIHALELEPMDRPVTEENPLLGERNGHGGDYDFSKAAAERLVRENSCKALGTRIIYPTAVLGPNDYHGSLFGQAIIKMAHGRLPAMVSGGFNWVDARDVAWGAVEAAEKGADSDRYILSGHYLSVSEVARLIAELTGIAAPRLSIPNRVAALFAPLMAGWARLSGQAPLYTRDSLAALTTNKVMSHARASRELAYQPRTFRASMRDVLEFYNNIKQ